MVIVITLFISRSRKIHSENSLGLVLTPVWGNSENFEPRSKIGHHFSATHNGYSIKSISSFNFVHFQ